MIHLTSALAREDGGLLFVSVEFNFGIWMCGHTIYCILFDGMLSLSFIDFDFPAVLHPPALSFLIH